MLNKQIWELQMGKVDLKSKTIFATGSAGFIGSNLVKSLYQDIKAVADVGIDNMNNYHKCVTEEDTAS